MKLGGQPLERFLRQPAPGQPVVLVYGPDQGLVRERVERLLGAVLDDPKDPFRLSELSADAVRADPGRLLDEARALCLVGGRRVVRVRQAGDQATAACRALLGLEALEALVVIDAGELGPGSSLRRLIEGAAERRRDRLLSRRRPRSRRAGRPAAGRARPAGRARRARLSGRASGRRSRRDPQRARQARALSRARAGDHARRPQGDPGGGGADGRRQRGARSRRSGPCRDARRGAPARALPRPPARRGRGTGAPAARARQPPHPPVCAGAPDRGRRAARAGDRAGAAADPLPAQGERQDRAAPLAGGPRRRPPSAACSRPRSAARPPAGRRSRSAGARRSGSASRPGPPPTPGPTASEIAAQSPSCIGPENASTALSARAAPNRTVGGGVARGQRGRGEARACCAIWSIVS